MKFSPGIKLVTGFGLTAVVVSAAALVLDSGPQIYTISFAAAAGVMILDLLFSLKMPGQIRPVFPETMKLSKNREAALTFELKNQSGSARKIKIAIQLDESGILAPFEKKLEIKKEGSLVEWPMKGRRQGHYTINTCWIQTPSRMGLWEISRPADVHCDIHVYPDISKERKNLAALFTGAGYGIHARKYMGKGREFKRLREYLPGDNYEDIYWKATARRGGPVTKIFQVEKTQDVYVMLDASRLSARETEPFSAEGRHNGESILEKFISTSLTLGLAARRQGDRFGIGVFSDRIERFLPAGSKKSQYNLCRDALFTLEPRQVTPDFSEWITFIGNKIRKRALLIILTSMDDPAAAETFIRHIHILSRRHLVMVNMLKPPRSAPLFSSDRVGSTEDIYEYLSGHIQWDFLRGFEKSLHRMGISFCQHRSADLTFNIISQYLEIKQRQSL